MQLNSIAIIAAAEVAAVLLVFCIVLVFQNRSLRGLIEKLQTRMTELVEDLKTTKSEKKEAKVRFLDHINEQLEKTQKYHSSLNPNRDIVLDLAPDTDLARRTAALRYAILLAEKEAILAAQKGNAAPDWSLLKAKYQQIFNFYEDYSPELEQTANNPEIEALSLELENAKSVSTTWKNSKHFILIWKNNGKRVKNKQKITSII